MGKCDFSGGGYVLELRGDIDSMLADMNELESDGWIDRYTRAIFIEFTTYNAQVRSILIPPSAILQYKLFVIFRCHFHCTICCTYIKYISHILQVNLFGITTLVAEFMKSGGIALYGRVEPVNLMGYYSSAMLFQVACQIIYIAFILFFLIKEIRKAVKGAKEYLQEPWTYVELIIISLSLGGVAIYIYRWLETKKLTKLFKETNGNAYMKFQYVGYWNEMLLYMVHRPSHQFTMVMF